MGNFFYTTMSFLSIFEANIANCIGARMGDSLIKVCRVSLMAGLIVPLWN